MAKLSKHPKRQCLVCGSIFNSTVGRGNLCSRICADIYLDPKVITPIEDILKKNRVGEPAIRLVPK